MKEIALFSPACFQQYGHENDYVSGLVSGFCSKGYTCHVIGYDGPLEIQGSAIITHKYSVGSITHSRKKLGFIGTILWGIKRVRNERKLYRFYLSVLAKHKAIEHTLFETFEYMSLSSICRKNNLKGKYSCVFHDTNFNRRHDSVVAGMYKSFVRGHVRQIIKNAVKIYVHGDGMRSNFLEALEIEKRMPSQTEKIMSIPYGAPSPETISMPDKEEAKEKLALPMNKNVLLSFGTIRKDKIYLPILDAIKESSEWILVFAGPEGDAGYEEIVRYAETKDVSGKIFFFNQFIPQQEHALYFSACDLVINLYADYIRHESGTAQKARAFLKPVIVGGSDDLTSYVEKYGIGWKVSTRDFATIIKALKEFQQLTDEGKHQLTDNIKRASEERSWESVTMLIGRHSGL